jgi:short-subunit dehydrogenase
MPQGVPVTIIKPGPVVTDIWARARRGSDAAVELGPEARARYGDLVDRVRGRFPVQF